MPDDLINEKVGQSTSYRPDLTLDAAWMLVGVWTAGGAGNVVSAKFIKGFGCGGMNCFIEVGARSSFGVLPTSVSFPISILAWDGSETEPAAWAIVRDGSDWAV